MVSARLHRHAHTNTSANACDITSIGPHQHDLGHNGGGPGVGPLPLPSYPGEAMANYPVTPHNWHVLPPELRRTILLSRPY